MHPELEKIGQLKVIPVVAINDAADAVPLAEALIEGGLPCAEVTFRTAAGLDSMKAMAKLGNIQVIAGTVCNIDQVKAAVDAGCSSLVSPGINEKVVDYCAKNNILITPGIATPSDIEIALNYDLEVVKFFPAEAYGGLNTIKALAGPYHTMKFMPTGGISAKNLLEYLAFPKVLACGGSWMVKADLISDKKFDEITALTKEAVELANSI